MIRWLTNVLAHRVRWNHKSIQAVITWNATEESYSNTLGSCTSAPQSLFASTLVVATVIVNTDRTKRGGNVRRHRCLRTGRERAAMKIRAWVLALLALGLTNPRGFAESTTEVRDKLVEMGTADQAVRGKLVPLLASGNLESDEIKAVAQEMALVDAQNLAELRAIIARHGWPRLDVVGSDASTSAFLILQHSPLEAQKELLPTFREAALAGHARRDHLAMLEDRILLGDGKKQRYGTQITAGHEGVPKVNPVEDPENLEARRKAMGLPTMKEYLDRAAKDLGKPIDASAIEAEAGQ